jgi:outer membrane protein insertion porin family
VLWSVGGGLRWRTVIGPVRLEYGYNLTRRPFDPAGTLQLSLGYPF